MFLMVIVDHWTICSGLITVLFEASREGVNVSFLLRLSLF